MGDIHGNLQAFQECLRKCAFDESADSLIQLGDVSDRHLFTAEVVEELLYIPSLIAIRGNHDAWTGDWLGSGVIEPAWLENGGKETLASYERNANNIDRSIHKQFFLQSQLDYHIDEKNRLFIHAGYVHPKGPAFEKDPSICYWDRSLWKISLGSLKNNQKPSLLEVFDEIFIGHTPTLNWFLDEPMHAFNVWNLDTGAGTTGKLTIMDVVTKEYWQSS